jgi:hypothetical protein
MTLSWNEIKDRALKFSKEWADTSNEEADAKPFLVEFFNVFGITSKRVSTFEHRVKKLDDKDGYIDLLWKGTILIEMKSRGKNLDKAYGQAIEYTHGLKEHELPKYILISDFENFRLYDLEENKTVDFKLNDLVNNVQHFGYLLGYQKKVYKEQDPANIKAAELMGKLHDRLEEIGYTGHPLEVYLVRILFCLFAEDTTIFNKQQFQEYIEQRTNIDGSDLAAKLQELFQVLNTPKENRFKNLDEQLADFPYVNGKLFEEILPTASFDSKMRQALLDCSYIDWSKISPAIFGSMFQSVMNPKERRNLGAHYTSETNILKLIKPLFLDELWKEFESVKDNKNKLPEFHKKLSTLKFLDPACGCGNFLVITYRELRLLEFEVLKALNKSGQTFLDVSQILWINVDQFSGIEYEEFPARIAEVAMWLIDHQMNMLVSSEFGQYFIRLPLKKSANIVHADALETDWENVVTKNELSFIIGNPPFIGSKIMKQSQRDQIVREFDNADGSGIASPQKVKYSEEYVNDAEAEVIYQVINENKPNADISKEEILSVVQEVNNLGTEITDEVQRNTVQINNNRTQFAELLKNNKISEVEFNLISNLLDLLSSYNLSGDFSDFKSKLDMIIIEKNKITWTDGNGNYIDYFIELAKYSYSYWTGAPYSSSIKGKFYTKQKTALAPWVIADVIGGIAGGGSSMWSQRNNSKWDWWDIGGQTLIRGASSSLVGPVTKWLK